jgi:hypothetical protein
VVQWGASPNTKKLLSAFPGGNVGTVYGTQIIEAIFGQSSK